MSLITIDTSLNNVSYPLFKEFPEGLFYFNIDGNFKSWNSSVNEKFPNPIEITLTPSESYPDGLYHISLVEYCKRLKHFEVHIEPVDDISDHDHTYIYDQADYEKLNLNPGTIGQIRVWVILYNSGLNEDNFFFKCGKPTKECLNFPHDSDACEKQELSFAPGPQPDTKDGNVIIGA